MRMVLHEAPWPGSVLAYQTDAPEEPPNQGQGLPDPDTPAPEPPTPGDWLAAGAEWAERARAEARPVFSLCQGGGIPPYRP